MATDAETIISNLFSIFCWTDWLGSERHFHPYAKEQVDENEPELWIFYYTIGNCEEASLIARAGYI